MIYPNNLRDIRQKQSFGTSKVKAEKLAELLGVTFQHYYALERGDRQLSAQQIRKLANFLNVTTDEIINTDSADTMNTEKTAGFVSWLKETLKNADISPAELSRKSQVRDSTISRILSGKAQPTPSTVEKIGLVLSTPYGELMVLAGYPGAVGAMLRDDESKLLHSYKHMNPAEQQLLHNFVNFIEESRK